MQFLLQLATLIMGAAAAASLTESVAKGSRARREHRELKRGMILPKEAARELERLLGGRVVVGKDLDGPTLVVMRTRRRGEVTPPSTFAGYRVQMHLPTREEAELMERHERAKAAAQDYLESQGLIVVGNIYE